MADTWSYSAGDYGNTVRVYERTEGGVIYAATADGQGGEIRRSLGHRDKEKAKSYADEQAAKLREGMDELRGGRPTVGRLFRLYKRHRVPDKSEAVQAGDERRMKRWRRSLGRDYDLSKLSRHEWDAYKRKRKSGELDAKGREVPDEDERREVSTRTVEKDLRFLRSVCRWARDYRGKDGRPLLRQDPTRGLDIPKEKNPTQPVATHDRVEKIREHYHKPTMRLERGGQRERVESYLPEIFEIVVGTGRRISAVCSLREQDLELEETPQTPNGAIVWPEDTDKMGKRWRCPISATVREALESALRKRRAVGPGPLFPSPGNPEKPVRYEEASEWLREAEKLAELEPIEGGLWHPFRRLWATSRKDLPDVDVARAGGWASLQALQQAYQQPDDETMLQVVEHDGELREVK